MSTVEVTTKSWGSRLMESIRGIAVGLVLFVVAFPVLFFNEGRAVHRARVLEAGRGAVVSLAEPEVVAENQGRLVHLTGPLATTQTLNDPQVGVEVQGVRLRRTVEMYQWRERTERRTEKQVGGSERTITTHNYERTWAEQPIDASGFRESGHYNPPMPLRSATFDAHNVTVGQFQLSPVLVSQVSDFRPVTPSPQVVQQAAARLGRPVHVADTRYVVGQNPNDPQIGDLRLTFEWAPAGQDVSLLGQQVGTTFSSWRSDDNTLEPTLRMGRHDADAMFGALESQNATLTYILRVLGFLAMMGGLFLVFRPMVVMADVLPILGYLVQGGAMLTSFAIAFGLSLMTIAAGWVTYRPWVGIPLIVLGLLGLGGGIWVKVKRVRAAGPTPGQAQPQAPAAS